MEAVREVVEEAAREFVTRMFKSFAKRLLKRLFKREVVLVLLALLVPAVAAALLSQDADFRSGFADFWRDFLDSAEGVFDFSSWSSFWDSLANATNVDIASVMDVAGSAAAGSTPTTGPSAGPSVGPLVGPSAGPA